MKRCYDVVIIGGGPGGCTAALYCARSGLSTLVAEQMAPGGQMAATNDIDNYPGFPDGIDGFDLAQRMQAGAHRFGAETLSARVTALSLAGDPKEVETTAGRVLAHCVILATGAYPRPLGVPGEEELRGRGVSYCATCDGAFYRGKDVAVVGGGNSACAEALHLARLCGKVRLIHRRDALAASRGAREQLEQAGVELLWNRRVAALEAQNGALAAVELEDVHTGERHSLPCQGLFIAIGREPDTALLRGQVALDERGYVLAGEDTKTDVPGVFAVGDLRQKPLRQIVTAAADGAVASLGAEAYLRALGL